MSGDSMLIYQCRESMDKSDVVFYIIICGIKFGVSIENVKI
jgi:hypothetical protein